ncbi:MAG TPA: GyrI-like domain-containing protein [Gemmatimonadales bacterium]|nr:GyrI-like domain-containing protein [Gemmatimonadales bacterium]
MPGYEVELQEVESIPLAVIRGVAAQADLRRVVPEWCGLVWNAVREQKAKAGRHVAVYWDAAIRLEVGVELFGPFLEKNNIARSATPGGRVATVTHFGPYRRLGAAHEAIHAWCKSNNHRQSGPSWEIYGHWDQAWDKDPTKIRTDIYYQLTTNS